MEKTTTQQKTRDSKFARIILAGVIGTIAFNGVMYADIAITGIPLDIVAVMGNLAVGESEHSQTIGHIIHIANGIGLTILFGYVVVPISKRIKKLPVIVYAILFAVMEVIIAVWFVMLPMLGAGVAGLNIASEVPAMTMIRHIVFGVVIGVFTKPVLETRK